MIQDKMIIIIDGREIAISRKVYEMIFENSFAHDYKDYKESLVKNKIHFNDFVELTRKTDLPYSLFFAPEVFVKKCLDEKDRKMASGMSKNCFSMNSRGRVQLRDIELIVRDLIRKQGLLKRYDGTLVDNTILSSLKKSKDAIEQQAETIRKSIRLDLNIIKSLNKTKTFEYLRELTENSGIFVSQSSHTFMPQIIRPNVRFSGLCIKDNKVPFIFLNNKEETVLFEPEGRKSLTLVLLVICMAKGKFQPISYDEQTKTLIRNEEFLIAEEVLMPKKEIVNITINDLDDVRNLSDLYSVTPSAMLMRLKRLSIINDKLAEEYHDELENDYISNKKGHGGRRPAAEKGYKKYNSVAYSKNLMKIVDAGKLNQKEAVRVLFQNKKSIPFLYDYRASL